MAIYVLDAMGSTTNPQPYRTCPNCGIESGYVAGGSSEDGSVVLYDCENTNCGVDRFWGQE